MANSTTVEFKMNREALAAVHKAFSNGSFVKIGLLSNEYKGEGHKGIGAAALGAVHEFGSVSRGIPSRSFLRMTTEKRGDEFNAWVAKNRERFLAMVGAGDWSAVLGQLGAWWLRAVQQTFKTRGFGQWRALSPRTIARRIKNTDIPLQDSGALLRSIMWQVVKK